MSSSSIILSTKTNAQYITIYYQNKLSIDFINKTEKKNIKSRKITILLSFLSVAEKLLYNITITGVEE